MREKNKLVNGEAVVLIVEGEDTGQGNHKAFLGHVLGHEGNGLVTFLKVTAGENYGEIPDGGGFVVVNGTKYYGSVPHGDPGQGDTFIFPNEIPAGFPRG